MATVLAAVHPVLHIQLLKKCVSNQTSIVPLKRVVVKYILTYEEVTVKILNFQVQRFRNKEVTSVKVSLLSQYVDGSTWEAEETMKAKNPHLFPPNSNTT